MATVQKGGRTDGGFMGHVGQMLHTHPGKPSYDESKLRECIEACFDCAQSCIACADACLGEQEPKSLARCIRLNQDCANVCETTGKILSRQTAFEKEMATAILRACATACRLCAEECEEHAQMHEHCRVCADACRRCEQACNQVMSA